MPVRKQTPSFHPVLFSNSVQTNEDGCFLDSARQVMKVTTKVTIVSATEEVSDHKVPAEQACTYSQRREPITFASTQIC